MKVECVDRHNSLPEIKEFDQNIFKNIQIQNLDHQDLIQPPKDDLSLAGPSFSCIERNIENEILNSSTDNSSHMDEVSAEEESDNGSLSLGIDLSDVGTKILDRKRLRIFENITVKNTSKNCLTL